MQACEQGNEESSGLGESYNELTGHMTEASGQFFQHWLSLVELEEAPVMGKRAEIWATSGVPFCHMAFDRGSNSGLSLELEAVSELIETHLQIFLMNNI